VTNCDQRRAWLACRMVVCDIHDGRGDSTSPFHAWTYHTAQLAPACKTKLNFRAGPPPRAFGELNDSRTSFRRCGCMPAMNCCLNTILSIFLVTAFSCLFHDTCSTPPTWAGLPTCPATPGWDRPAPTPTWGHPHFPHYLAPAGRPPPAQHCTAPALAASQQRVRHLWCVISSLSCLLSSIDTTVWRDDAALSLA